MKKDDKAISHDGTDTQTSRVETVLAAALYLMSHYQRSACPRVALCVARHLQCLALHPDAPPVIRDVCAALHGNWNRVAGGDSNGTMLQ